MKKREYIPHPKHIPFEYNKIDKYIYLGSNQCCQKHFEQTLLKKGIKADISLEKEKLDNPKGVQYFVWIPVTDFKAPTQKQLITGANIIKNFIDNKTKIYVHCKRGHGRSPTMVAAYYILKGLNSSQAIKKIRNKRPCIHLKKSQLEALKNFEKTRDKKDN